MEAHDLQFQGALRGCLHRRAALVVDRAAVCQQCVDPHFLHHGDRATSEKALRCLRHVLSLLSLRSTPVEKKLLLGQAAGPRKRGRAPTVGHLATATCEMYAKQKHRRMRTTVMRRVLGENPAVRQKFSSVLASFAVSRGADKEKLAGTSRLCLHRGLKRNIAAVDVFHSQLRPLRQQPSLNPLLGNSRCTSCTSGIAPQPKLRQTREYSARQHVGALRSRRFLESVVCRAASLRTLRDLREHSSWEFRRCCDRLRGCFATRPGAGGERRQNEGSESHALRLRPLGDLEPPSPM